MYFVWDFLLLDYSTGTCSDLRKMTRLDLPLWGLEVHEGKKEKKFLYVLRHFPGLGKCSKAISKVDEAIGVSEI